MRPHSAHVRHQFTFQRSTSMSYQPHHQHSISHDSGQHDNFYSAANALYQSGQTFASAGIPNNAGWSAAQPAPIQPQPQPGQGQGYRTHRPSYSNGSISRQSSLRYAPPAYQQQQAGLPSSPAAQLSPRRPTLRRKTRHTVPILTSIPVRSDGVNLIMRSIRTGQITRSLLDLSLSIRRMNYRLFFQAMRFHIQ